MKTAEYERLQDDVDGMASYWQLRLASPDCTPEDRYAFETWKREDPAHADAYARAQRAGAYVDQFMGEPAFQALIDESRERTKPPFWRSKRVQWTAAACAAALVATVVVITEPWFGPQDRAAIVAFNAEAYETRIGERSTVTLSDGSVVSINTNSRIEVNYTPEIREIRLARGQGFFEVAKDVNRPFVVEAGGQRVIALGTVFDVRLDDENEVQVTLVEGRVQVDEIINVSAKAGGLEANSVENVDAAPIKLSPGERLVAKANATPEVVATDGVEETSWRNGQLIFRNRPLEDVVSEMNRYSTQRMVLGDDERLTSLKVSGIFNNGGPPASFVGALEAMHPLTAERTGQNELTLVWRD